MSFLIGLTTYKLVTLPKISENNKMFVGDIINAFANNTTMLPSHLKVADIKSDITLTNNWMNWKCWLCSL
jgi:hypothetical protein